MKCFPRKHIFSLLDSFFSINIARNDKRRSINRSRNVDIVIFITNRTLLTHISFFLRTPSTGHFKYPYGSLYKIRYSVHIKSIVQGEWRLTFLAALILIISNVEENKSPQKNLPFCRALCKKMKTPVKDRKTDGNCLVSIFSFRV
jgi:hypothetical protein